MIRLSPKEKPKGLKRILLKRKPFKRKPPKSIKSTLIANPDFEVNKKAWELKKTPLKWRKISWLTKTPPKHKTIKPTPSKVAHLTKKPPKKRKSLRIRIDPLDALFSLYIRTRDHFTCQRCGVKSKNVQCAHFIGRRNKNCRFLEINCVSLCYGCHGYFHANPLEFVEWTKKRLGERDFEFLQAQERIICKPDRKALTIYFQQKLKTT